jgi:NadR type nicotinamide-nucleotide adenylyltransferase
MENTKIIKIAIIGPESTGKSILSEQLARHFHTIFVPEFARDYFSTKNIESHTLSDLDIIYQKQLLWENEMAKRANRFLFCDTNLISGKVWADVVFKTAPKFIQENLPLTDHDLHLLCDIDLPWIPDAQRRNEYNRKEILQMHVNELENLRAKFEIIKGVDDNRLKNAISAVEKHFKF